MRRWRHAHLHHGPGSGRHGWRRPHGPVERVQHYFRARLHRRIFFSFGAAILVTIALVGGAMRLIGGEPAWQKDMERGSTFLAHQFAATWSDPPARAALVKQATSDLDLDFELVDSQGHVLESSGAKCRHPLEVPVTQKTGLGEERLGTVRICAGRKPSAGPRVAASLAIGFFVLWAASGKLARRLSRPFGEIARVAEELGEGKWSSRVSLDRHYGEARILAVALNDMAARIEKQLADQRALLATVSHELRTPLARIRLLSEMARGGGAAESPLAEIDREVEEIDVLVADLLASSRLDFGALGRTRLDADEVAERALEVAGTSPDHLVIETRHVGFDGDPTLVARAVANLLENAKRHGGGVSTLRVTTRGSLVVFEVEDDGAGLPEGDEARIFEPFYRRPREGGESQSLGLGLALVKRIAEAHAGRAYARTRSEGGALVGIELPRAT